MHAVISCILEDKNVANFIELILEANGVDACVKEHGIPTDKLLQELTPPAIDIQNCLIMIISNNWLTPEADNSLNEISFVVNETSKYYGKIIFFVVSDSASESLSPEKLDIAANLSTIQILDVKKLGINKALDEILSKLGCEDRALDILKPIGADLPSNSRVKQGKIYLRELLIDVKMPNPEFLDQFTGLTVDVERGWATRKLDDTILVYLEIESTNNELNRILDVLNMKRFYIHSTDKGIISELGDETLYSYETKFDVSPGLAIRNPTTDQIETLPAGSITKVEYYSTGIVKERRFAGDFTVNGKLLIPELMTVGISISGTLQIEFDGIYDASILFESINRDNVV